VKAETWSALKRRDSHLHRETLNLRARAALPSTLAELAEEDCIARERDAWQEPPETSVDKWEATSLFLCLRPHIVMGSRRHRYPIPYGAGE
jgi:hypothetical protein